MDGSQRQMDGSKHQQEGKASEIRVREIMNPREAAEYLNVHVRTIYRLARKGNIPGRKVGGSWRFKKELLDEWLGSG